MLTASAVAATATKGTCFGFAVDSAVPLRYLRAEGPGQTLTIVRRPPLHGRDDGELVGTWDPGSRQPLEARLYRMGKGRFRVTVGDGAYDVDAGAGIVGLSGGDPLRREERLWGLPALLCFQQRGSIPLHGAAVDLGGRAVVLAGPSHSGKTTLAAALHAEGHRILGEDVVCVDPAPAPAVPPGPAMLRLRMDADAVLDVPDTVRLAERDGRVHRAVAAHRRGDGRPVVLRAIVLLRWSDNGVRVEQVGAAEALPDLWRLSFRLPDSGAHAAAFSSLVDLARQVPVWNLWRPRRFSGLATSLTAIEGLCFR